MASSQSDAFCRAVSSKARNERKRERERDALGPAKTYILRGTPRTCAIKTRNVTDN